MSNINDYLKPIFIEGTEKILKQMRQNICKIFLKEGVKGTGFFCKIPHGKIKLSVLITNNGVINEKHINEVNEIVLKINNDKTIKKLNLENRFKFTNEKYGITVIEINDNEDEIYDFLELDEDIINDTCTNYIGKSIYILHYPSYLRVEKAAVSYGVLKYIFDDKNYNFEHYCSNEYGSAGAPILNSSTNKVIGMHLLKSDKNYSIGTFLNFGIKEYIDKYNEIKNLENINLDEYLTDDNEITIKYKINNNEKDIQIFDPIFVKNNKKNSNIIINDKEQDLCSSIKIEGDLLNTEFLEIKLKGIKFITDLSYMFSNCKYLSSLPDLSKWNTMNITNMKYLFNNCGSLSYFSGISKWNTNNVIDMSFMFNECKQLTSLPDISKWNTKNVLNMESMFKNCSSLTYLPDISNWNVSNVVTMKEMFSGCSSLTHLPDISKWNTINLKSLNYLFAGCSSLVVLPDISTWNTNNVISKYCMDYMFEGCKKLKNLPLKFSK